MALDLAAIKTMPSAEVLSAVRDSIRTFYYVPLAKVEQFVALGWILDLNERLTHHSEWSTTMEWPGPGEPKFPPRDERADLDCEEGEAE